MNRDELEALLREEVFNPFVIATKGGFSMAISSPRQTLVGRNALAVLDPLTKRIYHIPFGAIDVISEAREKL